MKTVKFIVLEKFPLYSSMYAAKFTICHDHKYMERLATSYIAGDKCDLEHAVPHKRVHEVSSVSCNLAGYHGTDIADRRTERQLY